MVECLDEWRDEWREDDVGMDEDDTGRKNARLERLTIPCDCAHRRRTVR